MPLVVDPQPGEEVFLQKELRSAHGHVFGIAISNQAVYLPAQKFSVKADPWYFKRTPLSEVVEVQLVKQKALGFYVLSAIMVIFGLAMTYMMLAPVLTGQGGTVSGWPIAILVGGIVVPFISKGRKTLIVTMTKGKYKWKPQMSVDKASRQQHAQIQTDIIAACKRAGIRTVEND